MPKTEKTKTEELNLKQEKFCQLYAGDKEFFGNGVQSYIEAYNPETNKPNWYKSACVSATQLLSNIKVLKRINEILELRGLNDTFVDKQLEFLITQNADLKTKVAAIREYNQLKKRITQKLEHTGKDGEPIETTSSVTYMPQPLENDYFTKNQLNNSNK